MGGVTPTHSDVLAAWGRIRHHVRQTPLIELETGKPEA